MQNEKNQIKSLGEEGSEVSAQMGFKVKNKGIKAMNYIIEASTANPETRHGYERGNLSDYTITSSKQTVNQAIKMYWNHGYWVEVYNENTKELLAGPFNPDEMLPPIFLG